jgi:hypothetical protein
METKPNKPPNKGEQIPAFIFLLAAFTPAILIMAIILEFTHSKPIVMQIVLFGINPLVTILASLQMFPRGEAKSRIILSVSIGLVIAILNVGIGFYLGCVNTLNK